MHPGGPFLPGESQRLKVRTSAQESTEPRIGSHLPTIRTPDCFYVLALENAIFFCQAEKICARRYFLQHRHHVPRTEKSQKILLALSPADGKAVWSYPQVGLEDPGAARSTTAGGLLFFGDDSDSFEAVDAEHWTCVVALQYGPDDARLADDLRRGRRAVCDDMQPGAMCSVSRCRIESRTTQVRMMSPSAAHLHFTVAALPKADGSSNSTGRCALGPDTVPRSFPAT